MERRQHERIDLRAEIEVTVDEFDKPTLTRTADISLGGMFVLLRDPPPVGSMVKFDIHLDGENVKGIARVTWIRVKTDSLERPTGMGLEIRTLDGDGEERLRRACFEARFGKIE